MTSSSLFSTNDKIDNNSTKNNKNDKLYNESITSFKAFDSVLFMNEFLGYDEYQISEKSAKDNQNKINLSHNSNEKKISKNIQDIKISPTLEKYLTTELLNSITNDSNKNQKCQHPNFISENLSNEKIEKIKNNESPKFLKITKKLFNKQGMPTQEKNNFHRINSKNSKKEKTLYEETINGFEYQLKFIENSVNNILPKSYKKISNKNNQKISSNNYLDKFKNNSYLFKKNENIANYNNTNFAPFDGFNSNYENNSTLDKENICNNHYNKNKYNDNGKKNHHQIHKLKINDNYYDNWVCNYCYCFNRGYRKVCSNCSKNRN